MTRAFALLFLGVILAQVTPAVAQTARGGIVIDLNRADSEGSACRLTFVAANGLAPLSSLVLETVLFDRAGRVAQMTLFDFGALPEGRRRVRQFDVAGTDCAALGQMLVNGVARCEGEGLTPATCAAALSVTGEVDGLEVAQ
ncbi:MAG: hypothetical protein ACK4KW_15065 [Gemmobacter sp.]